MLLCGGAGGKRKRKSSKDKKKSKKDKQSLLDDGSAACEHRALHMHYKLKTLSFFNCGRYWFGNPQTGWSGGRLWLCNYGCPPRRIWHRCPCLSPDMNSYLRYISWHDDNFWTCILLAEADCARNVVSMGKVFCNFKAPHGGFYLRQLVILCSRVLKFHTCYNMHWGYSDVLTQMGSWRNPAHWSRNLHRLIFKFGLTLMVEMTMLQVPVLCHDAEVLLPWPILKFSSWLKLIFKRTDGQPVLAGHKVANIDLWQGMFGEFWKKYALAFPGHKVFEQKDKSTLARCLPVLLHGDEGRGKLKRAVMATSVQPLLKAPKGKTHGHSFLSRFLYGILPGDKCKMPL